MKILVNIFCPIKEIFLKTNLQTLEDLLSQYKEWPKKKGIQLIITGYAVCIDTIRCFLKKFPDIKYRFEVTNDYDQIKSKCHLLNKYILESGKESIFYCEYDITVPNLFERLDKLETISNLNNYKNIGLWCFNHNVHQMTIYEIRQQIDSSMTILRPHFDNGLMIGTGCWLLNIKETKIENDLIVCPSYGYGHDDLHLSEWLKKIGRLAVVIKEWTCNHRSIEFPFFVEWKASVLTKKSPLTKEEYNAFWDEWRPESFLGLSGVAHL